MLTEPALHFVGLPPPLKHRYLCAIFRSSLRSISLLPKFRSCKRGCFYNHERASSWGNNISNLLQLPISLGRKGSKVPSGDYKALFDTGAMSIRYRSHEFEATCKLDSSSDDVHAVVPDDNNPLVLHHIAGDLVKLFDESSTPEDFRELALNAFSKYSSEMYKTDDGFAYTGSPPGDNGSVGPRHDPNRRQSFGVRGTCMG